MASLTAEENDPDCIDASRATARREAMPSVELLVRISNAVEEATRWSFTCQPYENNAPRIRSPSRIRQRSVDSVVIGSYPASVTRYSGNGARGK